MTGEEASLKRALTGYLPGDRPLLEELGVDFASIRRDAQRVVGVEKLQNNSNDLVGPILMVVVFGLVLAIRGRVGLGYLYFLSILSSLFVYGITSLMNDVPVELIGVTNIMGYAFLPTLVFALSAMLVPVEKKYKLLVGLGFSAWSTAVFVSGVAHRFRIHNKALLLAYPVLLVYICFMIVGIL